MSSSKEVAWSEFTGWEKAKVVGLVARMAKRGAAGDSVDLSDLQARVTRIERIAAKRKNSGK